MILLFKTKNFLEITSNFIIYLDFFELAEFGTNYGLQTADKAITGCTKVALRYFGPFPAERRLEMIDTLVFFCENITLQNTPDAIVHRDSQILVALCGRNGVRNLLFKPFLIDAC